MIHNSPLDTKETNQFVLQTEKNNKVHKKELDSNDFMKLMITQLQHQDHTKPMDHTEIATQLSTINNNKQLNEIKDQLQNIYDLQKSLQSNNFTSYLGKNVKVKNDLIKVQDEKILGKIGFELKDSGNVFLNIKDNKSGELIKSLNLGSFDNGKQVISWDGTNNLGEKVNSGEYKFDLQVVNNAGNIIKIDPFVISKVVGINNSDKNIITETGDFSVNDILELNS